MSQSTNANVEAIVIDALKQHEIIAYLNGELAVKRIATIGGRLALVADNGAFPPIEITEAMDFDVWGVVTHVIHSVR